MEPWDWFFFVLFVALVMATVLVLVLAERRYWRDMVLRHQHDDDFDDEADTIDDDEADTIELVPRSFAHTVPRGEFGCPDIHHHRIVDAAKART